MATFFALLSALTYGTADFLGGFSSRRNDPGTTVAWSQGAGLATVLIVAPLVGWEAITATDLTWGVLSGFAGGVGVFLLFRGLSTGLAAIVSPVAALTGAVLPVAFGMLLGERPPLLTWLGIALCVPAILLLSFRSPEYESRTVVVRSLGLGLLSGACFGGFFVLISRSSDASGLVPLAAARCVTVPLFAFASRLRQKPLMLRSGTRRITLISGALDMAANVFYLLAFRSGYLIYAVVLSALYPAPTVVLQRAVLKERLRIPRVIGLFLSLAGASFIAIGG